jgi:peroxiredoxin Q/BCP
VDEAKATKQRRLPMLEEGAVAPDFTLPAEGGASIALAGDTAGCTAEAVDFSRLHDGFARAGIAVVGLSPDTVASHVRFRKKHGLSIPLAADVGKAAAEAYGVWVEKSMYGPPLHGRGAHHVPDRRAGPHRADLAQGEGAGPRRGRARRGQSARVSIRPARGRSLGGPHFAGDEWPPCVSCPVTFPRSAC